jgi:hypothetical protein
MWNFLPVNLNPSSIFSKSWPHQGHVATANDALTKVLKTVLGMSTASTPKKMFRFLFRGCGYGCII